jgi:hypothetical protein
MSLDDFTFESMLRTHQYKPYRHNYVTKLLVHRYVNISISVFFKLSLNNVQNCILFTGYFTEYCVHKSWFKFNELLSMFESKKLYSAWPIILK